MGPTRAIVVVLILVLRAVAGPMGYGSLSRLTSQSNQIVVGSFRSTNVGGIINATITVERAIKAAISLGAVVDVMSLADPPQSLISAAPLN
jgi:hypothetical protein